MGTPSLWSYIQVDTVFWESSASTRAKAMKSLQAALDRGRNFSLDVEIESDFSVAFHSPALELLAAHSERWRNLVVDCPSDMFNGLAAVKGKLPRLEYLEIELRDDQTRDLSLLDIAPSLKYLVFTGAPRLITNFPFE
ncbi:hypothetical protein B0H17DRAFT_1196843 [Mycena rosella]|uniref:Uncharacterized protein n=1 Tax=Mycena rosella TaxID=1033263 RepID=A0AAD7DRR6_MYCRO|nr:hypothetical protein B0H17DRAFT_1196843 [Mycena rosella]